MSVLIGRRQEFSSAIKILSLLLYKAREIDVHGLLLKFERSLDSFG